MNEELIRRAIQFKLDMAEKLLEHLPPEASKSIKAVGSLICDSVGEHLKNAGTPEGAKTPGKINNVTIE
jgi:hypothetical protein